MMLAYASALSAVVYESAMANQERPRDEAMPVIEVTDFRWLDSEASTTLALTKE